MSQEVPGPEVSLTDWLTYIQTLRKDIKAKKQELKDAVKAANEDLEPDRETLEGILRGLGEEIQGVDGNLKHVICEISDRGAIVGTVIFDSYLEKSMGKGEFRGGLKEAQEEFIQRAATLLQMPPEFIASSFDCEKVGK